MQNRSGSVGWQDDKSALECFFHMLENEIATDVCFEVGAPDGGQGNVIRAHKFVLVSRSSVFEAMLCGAWAESRDDCDVIKVPDIDLETFQELLRYMYTDKVTITPATALSLMYAAKKYLLYGLVSECRKVLEKDLSVKNVCTVLEHSRLLDEQELMTKCLAFVGGKAHDVMKTAGFFNLSRDTLEKVIESDRLERLESEVEVFKVCVEWAKRKLQTESQDVGTTDELIRETLGSVLFKIRFPTMSQREFADVVGESKILTPEEKNRVYLYIITKRNSEKLIFANRNREWYKERCVHRFMGVRARWISNEVTDAIDFQTTADTKLTAVGLYGGWLPAKHDVTIEVLSGPTTLNRTTTQMISDGTSTPVKIPLSSAVAVKARTRYTVAATIKGSLTFKGKGDASKPTSYSIGSALVNFATARFSNNPRNEERGEIPQLFFAVYSK